MIRLLFFTAIFMLFYSCGIEDDNNSNEFRSDTSKTKNQSNIQEGDTAAMTMARPAVKITGKKGRVLQSCIGVYELHSIEASVGANGLLDYSKVNQNWIASGSSISDGMRETYNIEIPSNTLRKLNNIQLEVDNNLNVRLLIEGVPINEISYNEEQLFYSLKNNGKNYISIPDNISKSTTFTGAFLYIFALDNFSKGNMKKIDILELNSDVVVLRYNQKESQFELNLFVGECCDNSFYYFKKMN